MSDDDARLAEIANTLVEGLERELQPWLQTLLLERLATVSPLQVSPLQVSPSEESSSGADTDPTSVEHAVATTSATVSDAIVDNVRTLLETDIDEQRANPLALVRSGLGPATELLRELGVDPLIRDPFVEQSYPDDVFDLAPATFGDIHESLHEAGLMWGAAKAHVHISRRKAEGLR